MCGRFTLHSPGKAVAQAFAVPEVQELFAHFNIAPTQQVAIVRCQGARELAFLRWGLIPSWADDPSIGNRLINARSETVATKPSFRRSFRSRRCLVVADGFYEWQKSDGKKQPFFIRLKSEKPFGFAGLWERWEKGEKPVESCTILTTEANELMKPIHERMPVIVPAEQNCLWLDPGCQETDKLEKVLRPYPSNEMLAYPVSTLVNSPKNDVAKCIEPLATPL